MKLKAVGKLGNCFFCKKPLTEENMIVVLDTPEGKQPSHAHHKGVMKASEETMLDTIVSNKKE